MILMRTAQAAVAFLASVGAEGSATAQIVWSVQFEDPSGHLLPFRQRIEEHVLAAGACWGREIEGAASIEVVVRPNLVHPRGSGRSVTTSQVGFFQSMVLYEQGAASEIRTGLDPNGSAPDVEITLNPVYLDDELWFDPEPTQRLAPVPIERTDAMSVMLHELGHALVYNGWRMPDTGDLPGMFLSTWDRWIRSEPPLLFFFGENAVAHWGIEPEVTLTFPSHWGNPAPGERRGVYRDMHAPCRSGDPSATTVPYPWCDLPSAPARDPSEAGAGATLIDELMNGVVFYRGQRYFISDLDRATLVDGGLTLISPGPPGSFQLIMPLSEAQVQTSMVSFTWSYASGASEYQVRIARHADGSDEVMRFGSRRLSDAPPAPLPDDATYYWSVFAVNEFGQTQASEGFRALHVPLTPPALPESFSLLSPADGVNVTVREPTLVWSPSIGATTYSLALDETLDFATPIIAVGGLTGTMLETAGESLTNNTRYYWRVEAHNKAGTTGSTPTIGSFAIVVPPCAGDANDDGEIGFSDITAVLTNWGLSGPAGDANRDRMVNFVDVSTVLTFWSEPCS